jgi:hypothetical protein
MKVHDKAVLSQITNEIPIIAEFLNGLILEIFKKLKN